jgi:hypothetical protein
LKTKDESFGNRRASPWIQMKNVLIIDNDLGFVFWLGDVLVRAGYQPWPARSSSEATSLAERRPLRRLDLLIVKASLPGVSGLIAQFRRTYQHIKVMAVGPQNGTLPGVNAWHPLPGPSDDSATQEWVRAIKDMAGRQHRAA